MLNKIDSNGDVRVSKTPVDGVHKRPCILSRFKRKSWVYFIIFAWNRTRNDLIVVVVVSRMLLSLGVVLPPTYTVPTRICITRNDGVLCPKILSRRRRSITPWRAKHGMINRLEFRVVVIMVGTNSAVFRPIFWYWYVCVFFF